jgi:UDP-glucose 4-epimerase
MIKILVTGGAGYIGSHCCKELYKKGYYPIVIDNLINGHRQNVKWGEFYHGDIGDYRSVDKCFKAHKIEAVIHFAAFAYVGESMVDPIKYYENNVMKTINFLSCMINNNVKKIVFSSTCATYGNPICLPIGEDHPQNPINPYGKTKLFIENILKDYDATDQLQYIGLRYFNAAGADPDGEIGEQHDPETHLIPIVLDVALGKREIIQIYGDD